MTQNQLEQAIAKVTGDSRGEIRRLGFSLVNQDEHCFDVEPDDRCPLAIDWDDFDYQRDSQSIPLMDASMRLA